MSDDVRVDKTVYPVAIVVPESDVALVIFHRLRQESDADDCTGMIWFVLHKAHRMMRDGKISKEQFAIIMDEAICY